jgi:hypothetical protein
MPDNDKFNMHGSVKNPADFASATVFLKSLIESRQFRKETGRKSKWPM